jgi:hypothetical protein
LEPHEPALDLLATRFALRLEAALDAAGYPVRTAGRVRALSYALGVDMAMATSLLVGRQLPDYGELLALCDLVQQQPGYFLDEQVLEVPPGTAVVKPMLNGEDLVLRLPSEVLGASDARQGLLYWRTPVAMGFGIEAGEYLIALVAGRRMHAQAGKLYLLCTRQGIDVVRCGEVQGERAVFHGAGAAHVPVIVPATTSAAPAAALRRLVASVRCGSSLHPRS